MQLSVEIPIVVPSRKLTARLPLKWMGLEGDPFLLGQADANSLIFRALAVSFREDNGRNSSTSCRYIHIKPFASKKWILSQNQPRCLFCFFSKTQQNYYKKITMLKPKSRAERRVLAYSILPNFRRLGGIRKTRGFNTSVEAKKCGKKNRESGGELEKLLHMIDFCCQIFSKL